MAKSKAVRIASAIAVLEDELDAFVIIYTKDADEPHVEHHGGRLTVRGMIEWFCAEWEDPSNTAPPPADNDEESETA